MPIHISRGSHAGSESLHRVLCKILEVTTGFEPVNNAFAERPLKPLEYVTIYLLLCVSVQQTKGFLEV